MLKDTHKNRRIKSIKTNKLFIFLSNEVKTFHGAKKKKRKKLKVKCFISLGERNLGTGTFGYKHINNLQSAVPV